MKKSIKYTILLLLSLLFVISCNDSDMGLIQNAMTDKYEEQYNVYNIIGRQDFIEEETNNEYTLLYLTTNKGIYSFSESGSFDYICSNGNEAKYDVLYCNGTTLVKRTPGNKYMIYDVSSNEPVEIATLAGKEFIGLYSPDGITFTYLFREKDAQGIITSYYAWSGEVKDSTIFSDEIELNELKETNEPDKAYATSIIGTNAYRREISNEEYIYTRKDNTKYEFTVKDGDNTKKETTSKTKFIGMNEDIYVRADGNFTTKDSAIYSTFKGMSGSNFVPVSNGDNPIYIYPGSSSFVKTSDSTEQPIKNISVTTPYSIVKHVSEKDNYLIMTLKHGAFVLDGTDMKSIKEVGVNFSDYIYQ